MKRRRAKGYTGPVLILCRKRAKPQWVEFVADQDPDIPIYVTGVSGEWEEDFDMKHLFHPRQDCWVIAHHEALSLPRQGSKAWNSRRYKAPLEWQNFVWETLILDEAHRFKDRRARRSMWLRRCDAIHKLALSGSPMERNPADYWAILNWMYPDTYTSYWSFFEEYTEWEHPYGAPPQAKVAKGLKPEKAKAFAELLAPISSSYTMADIAPNMPPKVMTRVPVEMNDRQRKIYDEMAHSKDIEVLLSWRDDEPLLIPNTLALIMRLRQLLSDPSMLNIDAESEKFEWLREFIEDNPDMPILVYSAFRNPAIRAYNEFRGDLVIGGAEGVGAKFKAGECNVLAGTIQAMGESLNFQRAKAAIFLDQVWSTIDMNQAVDRIYRMDITEPKLIYYLYTPKTVDTLVLEALDHKWTDQELVRHFLKEIRDEHWT